MVDHGSRDHATWSASATDRNWNCAGALTLAGLITTPEKENPASAWGTACHQVAEKCLRQNRDAADFIGTIEKTKTAEIEVDDELAETAQVYVDYVRERQSSAGTDSANPATLAIEQKFSLASLNPPFDAGGTADAVLHIPEKRLLEVIDLKGGRGVVVEARGNPQLRTYALGAVLANQGLDVETVTVTIVQPRAPHKDGRIRSETIHVADLVEWTADLLAAMRRAAEAGRQHDLIGKAGGPPSAVAWASQHLRAGAHCKFCRAAGICPTIEQQAHDAVGVWFDNLDQPKIANAPDSLSPEELSKRLDLVDMIEDWIAAVRAHAHTQAEHGVEIPNYILVDREGREKWADGVEEKVHEVARAAGLTDDKYLSPAKLRTPKQVRKALGKGGDAALAGLSATPSAGTNLVRANKTTRPAATPAVNKFFSVLD